MDIRVMQYYLAVTREGSISAAAESLHISQPSLSRQMKDLEEELGAVLFERGHRITLTQEGIILRKRAEEMLRLMQLTTTEISRAKQNIMGDIHIGAGESHLFHYIAQAIAALREQYPDVHAHVTSGDTVDLMEQLDNGLLDFALVFTDYDKALYQAIELPERARFGLLMRRDSPLAARETIVLKELQGIPLIVSRAFDRSSLGRYAGRCEIVATYNLINNAALMVEDGVGYALALGRLINVTGDSPLCFRPLDADISATGFFIWKKYQAFSPAVQMFLEQLENSLKSED